MYYLVLTNKLNVNQSNQEETLLEQNVKQKIEIIWIKISKIENVCLFICLPCSLLWRYQIEKDR